MRARFSQWHRGWGAAIIAGAVLLSGAEPAAGPLVIHNYESAGMDGRFWDRAFPGARTADAVHRSVLMRFPDADERIIQRLDQGKTIDRVELVFDFGEHELNPAGYTTRQTYRKQWENNPPRWHYVAWPLRRPWTASGEKLAPTFNAYLGGAGYWAAYGARDEEADRFPVRFGPMELSRRNPLGRMDLTPLFTDPAYGENLGRRLRRFAEQGLLVRKWETYDKRYDDWSAYEWAVGTGGHGLTFESARLEIHLAAAPARTVQLPPARNLERLAAELARTGQGGAPTAVMPDPIEIERISRRHAFTRPDWMPEWQWGRVQELRRLGGGAITDWAARIESGDPRQYELLINRILSNVPRYWKGWGVQDELILWHLYGAALPDYVRDHMKLYWESWLHPDLPNSELHDPQGSGKLEWWNQHQDWRGRSSFFRARYTQGVGTMNFNHTANMGALLGGALLGSDLAVADGRLGLDRLLLRFWSFLDGTSQEMLDHYYFSITLSAQKVFADHAPTQLDRLKGRIIRDRAVELLISAYHPHLRRAVNASGRTRMSNVLGYEQEGGYSVLHTLSPKGVLFHAGQPLDTTQHGMHLFGYDFPPGRVALQTIVQPWAPEWAGHMVDDKPLPYYETAAETTRNNFRDPPLWRSTWLGHHYGLASQDIKGGSVDVIAQWNPGLEAATDADQLGSLTVRYNINEPRLARTSGGTMPYSGGLVTFQDRNRAIVAAKPRSERERTLHIAGDEGVRKLYSTVALWNFRENPGWELFVDGEPARNFPVRLKAGRLITLRDGQVYVGIIPLPATDLGRDEEIVIEPGQPELLGDRHREVSIAPALVIHSYNLRRDTPIADDGADWNRITRETYGGFVIEMGDAQEHGDFAAFQRHMRAAKVNAEWEAETRILHIRYRSGEDLMEMGFGTDYAQSDVHFGVEPGQQRRAIPYRRINGAAPYLPEGLDRDTTLTQQGDTGRLEKNGAILEMEPGRKSYLWTEPVTGTYMGYNPFPELSAWSLTVPGGVKLRADGRLGLARIAVRPSERKVWVDHAYTSEQRDDRTVAKRLLVFGLEEAPEVLLNGRPLDRSPGAVRVGGRQAFAIPLF